MKTKLTNKSAVAFFVSLALIIFSAAMAKAGIGDLDLTFSGDGRLTDGEMSHGNDHAKGVAVQPDGKIVVAGDNGLCCGQSGFIVARYNPSGGLDPTFGIGGKTVTFVGYATAVAIQSDGKIVVGGNSFLESQSHFALIRYNSDGSLDTTFDSDGRVATPIGAVNAYINSISIGSDGKIVAAGFVAPNNNDRSFAVARYNPDGSLDTTFDLDGKVVTQVGNPLPSGTVSSEASSVTIQSDGKIVAAGQAYLPGIELVFALVRYNLNGTLDPSFDSDGLVRTSFGTNSSASASSVAIQPDGKIVAAGGAWSAGYGFALARYDSNGALDTTFDSDGLVISLVGTSSSFARSIVIQPDGKIVATGVCSNAPSFDNDPAVARFNSNGSLDTTFGTGGTVTTPIGSYLGINAHALQPDGKIVAVGSTGTNDSDFIVARYSANGTLDATFGDEGITTTDFVFIYAHALNDVAIQPDGKIVTAGAMPNVFAVARYNADGSRDTTFGGTGIVHESNRTPANAVAIQADGKIVAAGGIYDEDYFYSFSLSRYNANGSRDTSFGTTGVVITPIGPGAVPRCLVIQPDGRIVAAGSAGNKFAVVRYNSNGSLDTSFDSDGILTTPIGTVSNIKSVKIQPDGRIVAAGFSDDGTFSSFTTVRYNPNGALDTSFDGDGIVMTRMLSDDFAEDVVLQPNGKIIVGGCTTSLNSSHCDNFALARYNPNGSLDTTFDSDGKVITPFGSDSAIRAHLHSIAIQPDGKIVGAGYSRTTGSFDFTLVRYNPDGSTDNGFGGGDGKTTTDFDNANDNAFGMSLDQQGRAVVVGESDGRFAIARILLSPRRVIADFDGDGRSDISVFRPSDRVWYLNRSTLGFTAAQFGLSTDQITPADFDGDGKTDIAVYRGGIWYWLNSSNDNFNAINFGYPTDLPLPADFTGDGRAELAVYRGGRWWWLDLSNNQLGNVQFGLPNDKPVVADYDGDGRADQAVYRDGVWHLNRSALGYLAVSFGLSTDRPLPADYDGDGRTDPAVYRDGIWYLLQSSNGFTAFQFGLGTDLPAPADYNGDGKVDLAVFRDGIWHLRQSTGGGVAFQFGLTGDRPIPAALLP